MAHGYDRHIHTPRVNDTFSRIHGIDRHEHIPLDDRSRQLRYQPPFGLFCDNYDGGNLCFFYSVLHCIFHSPGLLELSNAGDIGSKTEVYKIFHRLINAAHSYDQNEDYIYAIELLDILRNPEIGIPRVIHQMGQLQKDAYEFFSEFINLFHQETKKTDVPTTSEVDKYITEAKFELNKLQASSMEFLITDTNAKRLLQHAAGLWHMQGKHSLLRRHYEIQTISIIRCPYCRTVRILSETMIALPVILPASQKYTPIDLQNHILEVHKKTANVLSQCNNAFCTSKDISQTEEFEDSKYLEKHLLLGNLPPCLVIHLLRFKYAGYDGHEIVKNDTLVNISTVLDLKELSVIDSDAKYRLYGVVVHTGSTSIGHYTSLIWYESTTQHTDRNGWYHMDGSRVHQVSEINVELSSLTVQENAYLLFYEKIQSHQS